MATEYIYLNGTVEGFVRLGSPDPKYDNFYVGLTLDAESKAKYAASGMQMKAKTSADGKEFITFRRKNKAIIKDQLVTFGAPTVLDANDQPLTKFIGKGTELTAKVIVYDTQKGKGHRLDAVKVSKLVEYVPPKKEEGVTETKKAIPF
jgi:hypothetical protein